MKYCLATIFNLIKYNCIHSNLNQVFKIKLGYKVHTYCKQDCIQIFFYSKFRSKLYIPSALNTDYLLLLLFFHRHPSGRWMFPGQPWYHPTAQLHHGFPRKAVRDFVTPFVLERLFDYSCSVEFAGSYYGHVPCKFRKVCLGLKYLPQINYGGNWPAWM